MQQTLPILVHYERVTLRVARCLAHANTRYHSFEFTRDRNSQFLSTLALLNPQFPVTNIPFGELQRIGRALPCQICQIHRVSSRLIRDLPYSSKQIVLDVHRPTDLFVAANANARIRSVGQTTLTCKIKNVRQQRNFTVCSNMPGADRNVTSVLDVPFPSKLAAPCQILRHMHRPDLANLSRRIVKKLVEIRYLKKVVPLRATGFSRQHVPHIFFSYVAECNQLRMAIFAPRLKFRPSPHGLHKVSA